MMARVTDYDRGVSAVDADYQRPGLAAVHLLIEGGEAAVIDTGASNAVPHILDALAGKGLGPEAVRYLILTHVHLDHAGGAGTLLRELPAATVLVHPRGARHMADPSKLVAGTAAVYGEEAFRALYGEVAPVPESRMRVMQDGESVELAGRELRFLDAPGHARHHHAIWDPAGEGLFSGDSFGISYRELDVDGRPFIFFTSSPSQFDPDAAHRTLDRFMALGPRRAFLMHYGRVEDLERLAADLADCVDDYVALARACRPLAAPRRDAALEEGMRELLLARLDAHGCRLPREQALAVLDGDIVLNAQGLGIWLDSAAAPGG